MADFIITPENVDRFCGPQGATEFEFAGHRRILNANQFPLCSGGLMFARPIAEAVELIPEEQWPDLISKKDREHSWLEDIIGDMPCKDQDGLGYCHGYGPTTVEEVIEKLLGRPHVELSAESVAGRVTNWQNQGGDPEADLQVLVKYGACEASFMDKPNSINLKLWKPGWDKNALSHRAGEIFAGLSGDLWGVAGTCAIRNVPTSPWYNWWSHCISGSYRLVYDSKTKKVLLKNRNNWGMTYGDRGYLLMAKGTQRGGGTPSGIVAIRAPISLGI